MASLGKCSSCLTRAAWQSLLTKQRINLSLGLASSERRARHSSRQARSEGFMQRIFQFTDNFQPHTDAHSKVLSHKGYLYELQFHYVKPECRDQYLEVVSEHLPNLDKSEEFSGNLVGSWTTQYGELDQVAKKNTLSSLLNIYLREGENVVPKLQGTADNVCETTTFRKKGRRKQPGEKVHLWIYRGGYNSVSKAKQFLATDKDFLQFAKERNQMLRKRQNQLLHDFHFWGEPQKREPSHVYELRSYSLKPGTLIEWSNNWGKAIKIRQNDAVGGFFSQIGELYQVHHIWAYDDLETRKTNREIMWQEPGWGDCVANTVPLVNRMESRLLVPTSFSPMQ